MSIMLAYLLFSFPDFDSTSVCHFAQTFFLNFVFTLNFFLPNTQGAISNPRLEL